MTRVCREIHFFLMFSQFQNNVTSDLNDLPGRLDTDNHLSKVPRKTNLSSVQFSDWHNSHFSFLLIPLIIAIAIYKSMLCIN